MTIINGMRFDTDNKITPRTYMHGYGTVVRELVSKKPKKSMCDGCRDDFYNRQGNSATGECWGFKSARVVDKVGYSTLNVTGGVDTIMKGTLNCWHAVSR